MKSKRTNILIVLLVVAALALVIDFLLPNLPFLKTQNLSSQEVNTRKKKAEKDYLELFSPEIRKKLFVSHNFITQSKHAYVNFKFGNEYEIIVYKVNLTKDNSLENILEIKKENIKNSTGVVYAGYAYENFSFDYSFEYDSLADKVIMSYDGTLLSKTSMADSIMNIYMETNKLSVGYDSNDYRDMVFSNIRTTYNPKDFLKMNFSLYKKKNSLYIIVIYSDDNDYDINEDEFRILFGLRSLKK